MSRNNYLYRLIIILACINSAIRQIVRDVGSVTYVDTLRSPPRSNLSLAKFLLREEPRLYNFRLRQIVRVSVFGYVCKYAPSTSHSNLRLTKNLLREEPRLNFFRHRYFRGKPFCKKGFSPHPFPKTFIIFFFDFRGIAYTPPSSRHRRSMHISKKQPKKRYSQPSPVGEGGGVADG